MLLAFQYQFARHAGRWVLVVTLIGLSVVFVSCAGLAAAEPQDAQVQQLVEQLESKVFSERQKAFLQLQQLGAKAIPGLRVAMQSTDRETAARARFLVESYLLRDLTREFQELANTPEDKIDLEHGMWLIARLVNPLCEKEPIQRELDKIAQQVRQALDSRDPKTTDPQVVVEILTRVLFVDLGFAGNTARYHHPDNSSIERVLATRKGLPILVSHVVVSVAERARIPIVGLAIPGRYMAKYDGDHAPVGFPKADVLIDPFGGRLIQEDDIHRMVFGFDPQVHLQPSAKLPTLVRMMTNLESHFRDVGKGRQAELTAKFRQPLAAKLPEQ